MSNDFKALAINPQASQIAILDLRDNIINILSTDNLRRIYTLTLDEGTNSLNTPFCFLNETSLLPISKDLESLELYNMLKDKLILKIKIANDSKIKQIISHVDLEKLLVVLDNGSIIIYDLLDGLNILDTLDIYKSFDDYQLFSSKKKKETKGSIEMNVGGQVVAPEKLNKLRPYPEHLQNNIKNRLMDYLVNSNTNGNICIVYQKDKLVFTSIVKEQFNTDNNQTLNDWINKTSSTIIDVSGSTKTLKPIDNPEMVLKNVVVYNTKTLQFEKILKNLHESGIQTMCLSEDGKILVTCSIKGTLIRCFKIDELQNNTDAKPFAEFRRGSTFVQVEQIAIDSNNELIAVSIANSEIIHIFNLKDYERTNNVMNGSDRNRFNKYLKKFTKRDHIRSCCHIKKEFDEDNKSFKKCILQFERINKKFDVVDDSEDQYGNLPDLVILYDDSLKSYKMNLNQTICDLSQRSPQIKSFIR
ncbi:hypothetical protein DAHU10_027230 [Hanseniaspora uvarum]|nr:hypothetical protein DAHU10_027230 [Hanseniaspora uvarum]